MILGLSILKRRMNDSSVTLYKTCSVRKEEYSIALSYQQFEALKSPDRPCIQDILPDFSADQREFLMTGITPAEWDESFGEEE